MQCFCVLDVREVLMWAAVRDKNREGSGWAVVGNPLASSEKDELQLQTCHMVRLHYISLTLYTASLLLLFCLLLPDSTPHLTRAWGMCKQWQVFLVAVWGQG